MSQSEQEFEEERVLNWLRDSGWEIKDGDEEPFIGTDYDRQFNEVVYEDVLKRKIRDINDTTTNETEDILNKLKKKITLKNSLILSNKRATSVLRSGGTYTNDNGHSNEFFVFDFDNPENNEFVAVNQFTYKDTDPYVNRIPDIVLFVNGIPISVIELKSVSSHSPTNDAISQIRNTYEEELEPLFVTNLLNIAMNQNRLRYGSVGASSEHYHYWKEDGSKIMTDIESHFKDLVDKSVLLDILERFVFFKKIKGDKEYAKIIPRHQQYYATKNIIRDSKESNKNNSQSKNLIVHVQGSGKTYAMMYAANILAKEMNYPVYIVVDEKELVKQFSSDLNKIEEINETIIDSDRGEAGYKQLKKFIENNSSGVCLTILHLFNELDDSVKSKNESVVFADEAHRFLDKLLGTKMDSILGDYHYYGFTGTPIKSTYELFSDSTDDEKYLHKYSMADAVNENAILPVDMVSRRDMIRWDIDKDEIDKEFDDEFEDLSEYEKRRQISKAIGTKELAGIEERVDLIVDDIVQHFTTELQNGKIKYKGLVVTKGRENAARYGLKLQEKLGEDTVDVLYSSNASDSELIKEFEKKKHDRRDVIDKFKDKESEPKLLVVCDMLRTGFDSPILKTIYLDRRFDGGHTLLQTLSRTNRTLSIEYDDGEEEKKVMGQIIDYQGITEKFEDLVNFDDEEIDVFTSNEKDKFKKQYKEQLVVIRKFFEKDYGDAKNLNKKDWCNELRNLKIQDEYIMKFRKLRTLHRNIEPDEFLIQFEDEYEWYSSIYDAVKTSQVGPTGEIEDKIIDIVEDNSSVDKKDNYTEKNNSTDNHEVSPLEITKKQATLSEIMRRNQLFDPRYEKLSERIEELIQRWNQDIISSKDALKELNEIEDESDALKEEIESSPLGECERALKSVIISYDVDEELSERIAVSIVERFDSDPPSTRKWWKSEEKLNNIRAIIEDELYPCYELVLETDIEDKLLRYLVQIKRE